MNRLSHKEAFAKITELMNRLVDLDISLLDNMIMCQCVEGDLEESEEVFFSVEDIGIDPSSGTIILFMEKL